MEGVFIHQQALVDSVLIGFGSKIWAFSHILKGAKIGKNCNISEHCFIENDVMIGNNVTIKCGIYIWDGVRIEDDVFLGPNVVFTNDVRPRSKIYPDRFEKTIVEKGASVGANSTIIAGNTIGSFAMVGAGSVVTKDVSSYTLVYGNPARFIGYVCECGKDISFRDNSANCVCGRSFKMDNGIVSCINPCK